MHITTDHGVAAKHYFSLLPQDKLDEEGEKEEEVLEEEQEAEEYVIKIETVA